MTVPIPHGPRVVLRPPWVLEHDGRLLGGVRLDGVDPHDKRARLAIGFFDPARLGMGLGREAIRLVLGYGFGPLGLHRVGLRVIAYNERAIRCYRACGFVVEGREREAALVGTEWHDDVMIGVLAASSRGPKHEAGLPPRRARKRQADGRAVPGRLFDNHAAIDLARTRPAHTLCLRHRIAAS